MSVATAASSADARSTVAVLGCGVIGASWVQAFLRAGHTVSVWDPTPGATDRLRGAVASNEDRLAVFETPEEATSGAVFIQENGPEDLHTKQSLFARISTTVQPSAILASSTSTLTPTELQNGSAWADRILVGHPFNPPHILPLVEVVGGKATSEAAIEAAIAFYQGLGKHPIRLRTERPGHLANRLQAALWREAVDAVASGQATVADVDAAVTLALGPRWAVMGPFKTFHLGGGPGGLAHFLDHLGKPFEALWDDARRPVMTDALKEKLAAETSKSSGGRSVEDQICERDHRLVEVMAAAVVPPRVTP